MAERLICNQDVAGSMPVTGSKRLFPMKIHSTTSDTDCGPDTNGALAQLVAQPVVSRKVTGSSPVRPAKEVNAAVAV